MRASHPPPTQAVRANFGALRVQVQIQKHERILAEPKEDKPLNPATSWAEVANRSVGEQRAEVAPPPKGVVGEHPGRWGGEKEPLQRTEDDTSTGEGDRKWALGMMCWTRNVFQRRWRRQVNPPQWGAAGDKRFQPPQPKAQARPWQKEKSPRIEALEKGLSEVRDLLHQLLERETVSQRTGGSKRQWHQGPNPATAKARLPLPPNIHTWTHWWDIPGDGSCLWHSLTMIMEEQWNTYTPDSGLRMKTQLLQEMRESRDSLADVLGYKFLQP